MWYQLELLVKIIYEISRLLNLWANKTQRPHIALKPTHVMPTLLLQKPSKTLKANYLKVLEIILRLWEEWNITTLVNESKTKQERLASTNTQMNIAKLL